MNRLHLSNETEQTVIDNYDTDPRNGKQKTRKSILGVPGPGAKKPFANEMAPEAPLSAETPKMTDLRP